MNSNLIKILIIGSLVLLLSSFCLAVVIILDDYPRNVNADASGNFSFTMKAKNLSPPEYCHVIVTGESNIKTVGYAPDTMESGGIELKSDLPVKTQQVIGQEPEPQWQKNEIRSFIIQGRLSDIHSSGLVKFKVNWLDIDGKMMVTEATVTINPHQTPR